MNRVDVVSRIINRADSIAHMRAIQRTPPTIYLQAICNRVTILNRIMDKNILKSSFSKYHQNDLRQMRDNLIEIGVQVQLMLEAFNEEDGIEDETNAVKK